MSVYIVWTEQSAKFDHWNYVGSGITEPKFTPTTVKKQCLFSNKNTPEMRERAQRYIDTDMQDRPGAHVVVK